MKLRGVEYGNVWLASGAGGFFGEGYWFHHYVPGLRTQLHRATFVAKTVTLTKTSGNMPLNKSGQPKELFPKSIWMNVRKGHALNAVALSNMGITPAVHTRQWQKRTQPFMISWMPITSDKLNETRLFVEALKSHMDSFKVSFALQVNLSCPNTGEDLQTLAKEAVGILTILSELGIPLIPKFNVLTSPRAVKHIAQQCHIDAVCISNTIPYGALVDKINWVELFGSQSPLLSRGLSVTNSKGGLSGPILFPLVLKWVEEAKHISLSVPINAGGGIMSHYDVHALFFAGASSVSIGTVIMLRPWKVESIIDAANMYSSLTVDSVG